MSIFSVRQRVKSRWCSRSSVLRSARPASDSPGSLAEASTGAPIDASAKLPGESLAGLADLKTLLREHQRDFTRCLTEKMLIYALGRGLDYYDEPAIARI